MSLQAKKTFLSWILKNYSHPNPEVNVFLAFLQAQADTLAYLEFSSQIAYAPRGIKLFYQPEESLDVIKYYKGNQSYNRVDQAFHDFRLNCVKEKQTYYIEFDFPDYIYQAMKQGAYVELPYLPLRLDEIDQLNDQLQGLTQEAYKDYLWQRINQALETHNFEDLNYWLSCYQTLLE